MRNFVVHGYDIVDETEVLKVSINFTLSLAVVCLEHLIELGLWALLMYS